MKEFKKLSLFLIVVSYFTACSIMGEKSNTKSENAGGNLYLIETSFGEITIKLYDETPQHKENFDKLVAQEFYNDLLFHRVIDGFMVQGGDPNSKGTDQSTPLGTGGPGYTIPAEIIDSMIHKKGALAAARQGDKVNPTRASSGSQFYIVQGKKQSDQELTQIENYINQGRRQQLGYLFFNDPRYQDIKNQIIYHQTMRNQDSIQFYAAKIEALVEDTFPNAKFQYSEAAKNTYKEIGGTPQLDGSYTVFGEVVSGLDIIDSIAKVKTQQGNRPVEDVVMNIRKL